jgi:hypothetical protein
MYEVTAWLQFENQETWAPFSTTPAANFSAYCKLQMERLYCNIWTHRKGFVAFNGSYIRPIRENEVAVIEHAVKTLILFVSILKTLTRYWLAAG